MQRWFTFEVVRRDCRGLVYLLFVELVVAHGRQVGVMWRLVPNVQYERPSVGPLDELNSILVKKICRIAAQLPPLPVDVENTILVQALCAETIDVCINNAMF